MYASLPPGSRESIEQVLLNRQRRKQRQQRARAVGSTLQSQLEQKRAQQRLAAYSQVLMSRQRGQQ